MIYVRENINRDIILNRDIIIYSLVLICDGERDILASPRN